MAVQEAGPEPSLRGAGHHHRRTRHAHLPDASGPDRRLTELRPGAEQDRGGHPGRVSSAVLLCTGAKLGEPAVWAGRIGQVSVSGTPVMVSGSAERWFGPGFLDRHPETGSALLHALQDTDDRGYIQ